MGLVTKMRLVRIPAMTFISHRLREARLAWLVHRSQRGDREAFRHLYRLLHGPVARFVGRRVRSAADAEDLVAEVFARLFESLDRVDGRRGTVLAYALAAARNAVVDRARLGTPTNLDALCVPVPEQAPDPVEGIAARQERERLRACLAGLPAEVRELLALRFGEELRHAEIALVMNLTEAAVRQRLSRAIRELRSQLDEDAVQKELANECQ